MDLTPENAAKHYDEPREREARREKFWSRLGNGLLIFTAIAVIVLVWQLSKAGAS